MPINGLLRPMIDAGPGAYPKCCESTESGAVADFTQFRPDLGLLGLGRNADEDALVLVLLGSPCVDFEAERLGFACGEWFHPLQFAHICGVNLSRRALAVLCLRLLDAQ